MTQYARPDSDVSNNGSWDLSTGSDIFALIDESSTDDSDYVSIGDPSDADFIVGLSDVITRFTIVLRMTLLVTVF